MRGRRSASAPRTEPVDESSPLEIESLDIDGQGIAHRADGKVVFVEGGLPGESVAVSVTRSKSSFDKAVVREILRESSQRVQPQCPHFGLHDGACGGCKMQHLHPAAQVATKQRALEDALWHLGKVRSDMILRPIEGPAWGYRHRARLSVRHVRKKDAVLVGFHERKSSFVADMRECHVLPRRVSALLVPLRDLVYGLQARETCPQIELAIGTSAHVTVLALVLRHLEPLDPTDEAALRDFARRHSGPFDGMDWQIQWWLQPQGPDSIRRLDEGGPELAYRLGEFQLDMPFRPTDFTQVNPFVNDVLVGRALRLLGVGAGERVIDWFCGLGNFTLPLATQAASVMGVEGSKTLVERARANAQRAAAAPGWTGCRPSFETRDLFQMDAARLAADGVADLWLLDPPREGAFALVKALADLRMGEASEPVGAYADWRPPRRIVYVSCNPATLARDAGLLVHQARYRCSAAGAINMFAHTAHVESIAVFDRLD